MSYLHRNNRARRLRRVGLAIAAAAGLLARGVHRYAAGIVGAALVVTCAAMIYPPAAFAVAGGFLLALDRKAPDGTVQRSRRGH